MIMIIKMDKIDRLPQEESVVTGPVLLKPNSTVDLWIILSSAFIKYRDHINAKFNGRSGQKRIFLNFEEKHKLGRIMSPDDVIILKQHLIVIF